MMWAYGFLNSRLVCLCATPAFWVTSSNQRSPGTDAPPARQATAINSAAAPPFFTLFADVFFLHERIGTLSNLHDSVCGHVLELLYNPRPGPTHHHFIDCGRIAYAEVLTKRILRPVAVTQHHFTHLGLTLHHDGHARAHLVPFRFRSHQFDRQPVSFRSHFVLEQRMPEAGRSHGDVQHTAVPEIRHCHAAAVDHQIGTRCPAHLHERAVAVVAKVPVSLPA